MSDPADTAPPGPLPEGYVLNGFVIGKVIGVGGFSIVYEAWDPKVEREIAIKEYMPTSLATRSDTQHVTLLSRANQDTFEIGLRSFVNEARLLGQLDHECLVKVYQFWEENGTAYMVMPRYRARTLKAVRSDMAESPREAWLRGVLDPVLSVLERLHGQGVFHRDIAPDNIMLREDGRPIVLDFGAARKVITGRSQMLTAILKPHYAPVEQYAETPGLRQGPWTDIYAIGATMRYLITGEPPMPATARIMGDDDPPLASLSFPGISQRLLRTIDTMLIPQPQKRPASVQAVRELLEGKEAPPAVISDSEATVVLAPPNHERTVVPDRPVRTVPSPRTEPLAPPREPPQALPHTPPQAPHEARTTPPNPNLAPHGSRPEETSLQARRAAPGLLIAAGLALAVAVAGGAWWLGTRSSGADHARGAIAQAPVAGAAGVAATSPPAQAAIPAAAPVAMPAPEVSAAAAAPAVPGLPASPAPTAAPPGPSATERPAAAAAQSPLPAATPTSPARTEPIKPVPARADGVVQPANPPSPVRPAPKPAQKQEDPAISKPREPGAGARPPASPAPAQRPSQQDAPPAAATRPGTSAEASKSQPSSTAPDGSGATRPAAPVDPNIACGGRIFIALDNCLRRQCALVEHARHPECTRVRGICELPAHASTEDCRQVRATWLRVQGRG